MALQDLSPKTLSFVFSFLFLQVNALGSDAPTFIYSVCVNGTEEFDLSDNSLASTTSLLSDLASNSSTYSFFSSKSGSGRNASYGLYYCTANVDAENCQSCVETATNEASLYCPFYKAAYMFYKECTLRYSNTTVYGVEDESNIAWYYDSLSASYTQFNYTLYSTLTKLISQATASSKRYATDETELTGSSDKLYALAQCTPDISGSRCQQCLQTALKYMPRCDDGGCSNPLRDFILTLLPSCQLQYEVRYASVYVPPSTVPVPTTPSTTVPVSSTPSTPSSPGTSYPGFASSSPGFGGKNMWFVFMLALAVVAGAFALH